MIRQFCALFVPAVAPPPRQDAAPPVHPLVRAHAEAVDDLEAAEVRRDMRAVRRHQGRVTELMNQRLRAGI